MTARESLREEDEGWCGWGGEHRKVLIMEIVGKIGRHGGNKGKNVVTR